MKTIYVKIEGIHCVHCINTIVSSLRQIKNISQVKIINNIAHINYKGRLDKQEIITTINNLDYFTKEEYISSELKDLQTNIKSKGFIIIFLTIILLMFITYKIFGFNIFNVIPSIDNSLTYGMLFITGFLTSIHCISMCGAINLYASFNQESKISIKRPLLYNIGRVVSYTFIGGVVGLLGNIISINDTIKGIIIILSALIMFLMSLNMLGIIKNIFPKLRFTTKHNYKNPFIIGLLNGLMPCGPLQAMEVYAISTASFYKGALSMFLFSAGTVPLMLFVGIFINLFKGQRKILINKIASVIILILSFTMLTRGISTLGFNINSFNDYKGYTSSIIDNDYQIVKINLSYSAYDNIIIQKGIKTKLIINAPKKYLTGCNEEIIIKEYNIKQKLKEGENIIEFTPTEEGTFSLNCWMNMIQNEIKVIDNIKYFEVKK